MGVSVCLCVCVCSRSYLRNYTSDFHQFLCMLPMAVARYSSDGVMILYVFPVLWMTSYLHISTETSIPHILNRILLSSDSGKSTIVISLDLSAAFDTIDHQILLSRLNTSFGISDDTLFLASVLPHQSHFLCSYWTSLLLIRHMHHRRSTGFRSGTITLHCLRLSHRRHRPPLQY